MKRLVLIGTCVLVLLAVALVGHTTQAHKSHPIVSVCTETGLTGPALQENLLYCANGTQLATSTYHQAIDLARKKHIIVGTPISIVETVNWANVPVTYVEFSSGFHAWHFHPSNGVAVIDDAYDRQVYP